MDIRHVLPFLLLLACTASLAPPPRSSSRSTTRPTIRPAPRPPSRPTSRQAQLSSQPSPIRPGRSSYPIAQRQNRRVTLNEYLVPPPPPALPPNRGRNPRLTNFPPSENEGYLSKFMSWLNPFDQGPSANQPPPSHPFPPPPPPPPASPSVYQPEVSASRPPKFVDLHPPVQSPAPRPFYDGPPPPTTFNNPHLVNQPIHSSSSNADPNTCNPCDSVPWIPMQPPPGAFHQGPEVGYPSSNLPVLSPPPLSSHGHNGYEGIEVAASQEIRSPDVSYASPLSIPHPIQDQQQQQQQQQQISPSIVNPLHQPHLHPGPMPPLFGATPFNSVPKSDIVPQENIEYLAVSSPTPPSWIEPADLNVQLENFSPVRDHGDGDQVVGEGQHRPTNISLTETQEPSYEEDPSNNQRLEDFESQRSPIPVIRGDIPADSNSESYSNALYREPSRISFDHDREEIQSNRNTYAEGTIHFEQSPLLDLTKTADFDNREIPTEITEFQRVSSTTRQPDLDSEESQTRDSLPEHSEALFGTTLLEFSTESNVKTNQTNSTRNNNPNARNMEESSLSNILRNGYLWSSASSTTTTTTTTIRPVKTIPFLEALMKSYENFRSKGIDKYLHEDNEESSTNVGQVTSLPQNSSKRSKQVQVIIPYTSQHTPLPFQQSTKDWSIKELIEHESQRILNEKESSKNQDNYIGQESEQQNRIVGGPKVISLDDIEAITAITTERGNLKTTRPTPKVNNSIDVHRLQKNIDNWTIQEYSTGTTLSTVSPSSSRPHLLPSKKIPDEYLVTTEPGNHLTEDKEPENQDVKIKTYALAGFSFNDLDHEESANVRVEAPRVQIVQGKYPLKNITNSKESIDDKNIKSHDQDSDAQRTEKVYVVTPQSVPTVNPKVSNRTGENTKKATFKNQRKFEGDSKKTKNSAQKPNHFELIERVYQMLPQAVNNLAVVSTGPENVPLWGIMEHEEYAAGGSDDKDDVKEDSTSVQTPVLYTGHSKVSHSRR